MKVNLYVQWNKKAKFYDLKQGYLLGIETPKEIVEGTTRALKLTPNKQDLIIRKQWQIHRLAVIDDQTGKVFSKEPEFILDYEDAINELQLLEGEENGSNNEPKKGETSA